jgi:hypothetical protein
MTQVPLVSACFDIKWHERGSVISSSLSTLTGKEPLIKRISDLFFEKFFQRPGVIVSGIMSCKQEGHFLMRV